MTDQVFSRYVNTDVLSKTGLGASLDPDRRGCEFRVWAPLVANMTLRLVTAEGARDLPMQPQEDGYFAAHASAQAGDRYFYIPDSQKPVPDPVSRFLPEGVHGPTEIVDPEKFAWSDHQWRGLSLKDYILYELHIGTFSPEGTLDAAITHLPYLKQLGITVIELMPVAAFPGTRNWGYDGVSPFAVQASYGGPEALRRFVDAAHKLGFAVILDVVYNHLGNEGNYLRMFAPYFTDQHTTPWGEAVNYDQPGAEGVRHYVTENARYWIHEYHLDGLRLDAIQTIRDDSSPHILAEITKEVAELSYELNREICVIAESDENDPRLVLPRTQGGYGLDAVWSDDFHHAIHAFFTGERKGYYQDFGQPEQIVRALTQGFVFQGEPFQFWGGKPRGASSQGIPLSSHVICIQNHDQVGNRATGDRCTKYVPRGGRMLIAALLLLSPATPLIFMGQEFDEGSPFLFFTDYGDPALQKAVSEGRRNEFKDFNFEAHDVPDPQDPQTFERSKLHWPLSEGVNLKGKWYSQLIELRKKFVINAPRTCKADIVDGILRMQVPAQNPHVRIYARLQGSVPLPQPGMGWKKALTEEADGFAASIYTKAADKK
jgi:maltooligosyltrehalose trehalohydrolase